MNAAVIVAAGHGKRMENLFVSNRERKNKQFLSLAGKPVLSYSLETFNQCSSIAQIVVVVNQEDIDLFEKEIVAVYEFKTPVQVALGGKERQDSVLNGLNALGKCLLVAIHDGARPFITCDLVEKAISEVAGWDGVVLGVPAVDTTKVVEGDRVVETIDRSKLWQIQTPQIFPKEVISEAHKKAKEEELYATDDAALVEGIGGRIKVIQGSYENIKITTPLDLKIAEAVLKTKKKGSEM